MRILVVSPVPMYATWDVFEGQAQGLRANGAEVQTFHYSKVWNLFADFKEFMEVTGRVEYDSVNNTLLAGDRVIMAAIMYDADLVHFVAPMHTTPVTLKVLKKYVGVKTSAYFTECPYDDSWVLKFAELFDYNFICDKTSLASFREKNPNTHYIGHAYNPDKHMPLPSGNGRHVADVTFVGTCFPSRISFLEAVDWTGIDLHLHGLMKMPSQSPLFSFVKTKETMPNDRVIDIYRKTRIGLQLHRKDKFDPVAARRGKRFTPGSIVGAMPIENLVAHSLGPRSYELAACEVFQVSDPTRPELKEVFGDSVPTYDTPDELASLIRKYLDDPVRREELARAQRDAVKPYTFENRMRTLLEAVG